MNCLHTTATIFLKVNRWLRTTRYSPNCDNECLASLCSFTKALSTGKWVWTVVLGASHFRITRVTNTFNGLWWKKNYSWKSLFRFKKKIRVTASLCASGKCNFPHMSEHTWVRVRPAVKMSHNIQLMSMTPPCGDKTDFQQENKAERKALCVFTSKTLCLDRQAVQFLIGEEVLIWKMC